jgi:hypothetical protein
VTEHEERAADRRSSTKDCMAWVPAHSASVCPRQLLCVMRSMVRADDFDQSVPLPRGLALPAIRSTIDYVERELVDFADVYFEQANLFSGLVGVYVTRGLDINSVYEKRKHSGLMQQRFPDLKLRGSGEPPGPQESLEVKASKRPWAVQSHYDHPGWYIVFRYLVDPTESFEKDRPVIIWRVDVAFLARSDWKYESSTAGEQGGGRTHTFGLQKPANKLKGLQVYARSDVHLARGKPVQWDSDDGIHTS